jgi:hypothetical protein
MKSAILAGALAVVACYPTTTRPPFQPVPAAQILEIELPVDRATTALAVLLDHDSIPIRRTEPRDGWLETGWFDVHTMQPTSRRVLGDSVVRVRAWIDPSRPNHSNLTVETVYRPLADPSRPGRELEQQVPAGNPVAGRVALVLSELARTYGGIDTTAAKGDSTSKAADSMRVRTPGRMPGDSAHHPPGAVTTVKKPLGDSAARRVPPDTAGGKPRPDTVSRAPLSGGRPLGSFLP